MTLFPDKERYSVLSDAVLANFTQIGKKCITDIDIKNKNDSINNALLKDFLFLLPNDMLNKVDWMSMQNSLEVRSPLLDYRVAEFGFQCSGDLKVKPTQLKYVLRHAFKNQLPKLLWNRKKQGFEIPVGEWFKKESKLKDLFWELTHENHDFFNVKGVERLYEEHRQNRHDNTHKLWAIFTFCWWLRENQSANPF
jgi:asparagine synthase (glutamine-hydrolysing)